MFDWYDKRCTPDEPGRGDADAITLSVKSLSQIAEHTMEEILQYRRAIMWLRPMSHAHLHRLLTVTVVSAGRAEGKG